MKILAGGWYSMSSCQRVLIFSLIYFRLSCIRAVALKIQDTKQPNSLQPTVNSAISYDDDNDTLATNTAAVHSRNYNSNNDLNIDNEFENNYEKYQPKKGAFFDLLERFIATQETGTRTLNQLLEINSNQSEIVEQHWNKFNFQHNQGANNVFIKYQPTTYNNQQSDSLTKLQRLIASYYDLCSRFMSHLKSGIIIYTRPSIVPQIQVIDAHNNDKLPRVKRAAQSSLRANSNQIQSSINLNLAIPNTKLIQQKCDNQNKLDGYQELLTRCTQLEKQVSSILMQNLPGGETQIEETCANIESIKQCWPVNSDLTINSRLKPGANDRDINQSFIRSNSRFQENRGENVSKCSYSKSSDNMQNRVVWFYENLCLVSDFRKDFINHLDCLNSWSKNQGEKVCSNQYMLIQYIIGQPNRTNIKMRLNQVDRDADKTKSRTNVASAQNGLAKFNQPVNINDDFNFLCCSFDLLLKCVNKQVTKRCGKNSQDFALKFMSSMGSENIRNLCNVRFTDIKSNNNSFITNGYNDGKIDDNDDGETSSEFINKRHCKNPVVYASIQRLLKENQSKFGKQSQDEIGKNRTTGYLGYNKKDTNSSDVNSSKYIEDSDLLWDLNNAYSSAVKNYDAFSLTSYLLLICKLILDLFIFEIMHVFQAI